MNLAFFLVSFLCSRSRVLCFSRGSLRQGTEKSTGRVNASPVDFTAAPAADVFPRKAPHPGENRQREIHQKEARGFREQHDGNTRR
ncbi:hypothetical protein ABI57_18480 [Salmonella enterica subsp. enterica serovar Veneziana]|nr:hypothetical protein ABI57_18480 [Salmonella enterica subsp. enterica serovar Veneziana]